MTDPGPSEALALDRVVAFYLNRGYQVTVGPRVGGLPEFLLALRPDLLAVRGDDRVAVIVRNGEGDLASRPAPDTETLRGEGWRVELVLADNPLLPAALPEAVAERLQEAGHLAGSHHETAALLLAWTAVDQVLRDLVSRFAPGEVGAAVMTPDRAFSLGLLSEQQLRFLRRVQRLRNVAAHTVAPVAAPPELIRNTADLVNRMAGPSYIPPPIMADRVLAEVDQRENPLMQVRRLFPEAAPEDQQEAAAYVASLRADGDSNASA